MKIPKFVERRLIKDIIVCTGCKAMFKPLDRRTKITGFRCRRCRTRDARERAEEEEEEEEEEEDGEDVVEVVEIDEPGEGGDKKEGEA
jgi:hydrogenase maturation factor HypF (carbamoyltransferase family)